MLGQVADHLIEFAGASVHAKLLRCVEMFSVEVEYASAEANGAH
jgi:hypothetical protein